MHLKAMRVISYPFANSNWSYHPETQIMTVWSWNMTNDFDKQLVPRQVCASFRSHLRILELLELELQCSIRTKIDDYFVPCYVEIR